MSEQNNNYTILAIVAMVAVVGIFAMVLKTTSNINSSESLTGAVVAGEGMVGNQVAQIANNPRGTQSSQGSSNQQGVCYELVPVQYSNKINAKGTDIAEVDVIEEAVTCNPAALPTCQKGTKSDIEGYCRTGEARCLAGTWYCSTSPCADVGGASVN